MYKRIHEDTEKLKTCDKNHIFISNQAERYLKPYTQFLYTKMDNRLVRTFFDAFLGILSHRDKSKGLLLSELGGRINGFLKAASGTKGLSNLFRCPKRSCRDIEQVHKNTSRIVAEIRSSPIGFYR